MNIVMHPALFDVNSHVTEHPGRLAEKPLSPTVLKHLGCQYDAVARSDRR